MNVLPYKRIGAWFSYVAVFAALILVCQGTYFFMIKSKLSLDFENILGLNLASVAFLSAIIGFFLTTFYGVYLHTVYVQRWEPSNVFRTGFILTASAFCAVACHQFGVSEGFRTVFLSLSIFAILSDLFINPPKKNLTYIITWSLILSIYISMVLFNGYIKYDFEQRKCLATSLYHAVDSNQKDALNKLKEKLELQDVFEKILSVPFPFKIHRSEFRDLSASIFKPFEDDKNYLFNAYDRNGDAMLYETYTPLSYYEQFIQRSIKIDDETYFDPIKNIYLKKWEKDFPAHQNAPFTIYLEQLPKLKSVNSVLYSNVIDADLGKFNYVYFYDGQVKGYSSPHVVFNEDLSLALSPGETHVRSQFGQSDFFVALDEHVTIKLSRKSARLIKPISLFSFIFIIIALWVILVGLINSYFNWLPYSFSLRFQPNSSLRNKLQLSIISMTILTFFIVGVVTIYYFYNLSSEYDQEILREKTISMSLDMESQAKHLQDAQQMMVVLRESIASLAKKHHMDMNIYDANGTLLVSSIPKMYEMNLKEAKLNPKIVQSFQDNVNQIQLSNSQYKDASLHDGVLVGYFPVLNNSNALTLIVQGLNPPSLEATSKVSDFVGTLLNVYVFLFLFAGAIVLAVSNSITKPLVQLGKKLKQFKLGYQNEPLQWKSNDELGQLVVNYNEMVEKLDHSAKMLAKNQRDLAWREMAKQVAHEIKNPLTPMKLSIQYLERAVQSRPEEAKKLIHGVSKTLIEQIDNLSGIANAFSNFGKMPIADNNKIVLNEVVGAVYELFQKRDDMSIRLYMPIDEIYVFADKNQMIRILNNIIKNAIQAIPYGRKGEIVLRLVKSDSKALISIEDNGVGIPDSMKEKVFSPNFTTKSSGTGLGLAMCANMVEAFNGSLYFNNNQQEGATFFIEIPLMHLSDNFERAERILL